MKSTGIIRRLDELGRVVIPIEIRNKLKLAERDPMEIFVDGSNIILKKFESECIFCGSTDNIQDYKDKPVCKNCIKKMSAMVAPKKKTNTNKKAN